tara:strand:- start:277 stop:438 length:162 start_codon:yes stop_codon:yes gene_type:complete
MTCAGGEAVTPTNGWQLAVNAQASIHVCGGELSCTNPAELALRSFTKGVRVEP